MKEFKKSIIFVMGVSGVGKSTIGNLLANELKIPFFDGDDFHPESNILKMSNGEALNDDDRLGWLQTLNKLAIEQLKTNSCVIVCSALKENYRKILTKTIEGNSKWVFLHGSFEQIKERMNKRENHFMSSNLLKSQFETLEKPKNAIQIDINLTPSSIVEEIKNELTKKTELRSISGGNSDVGNWLIDRVGDAICSLKEAYDSLPSWSEIGDAMSETLKAGYGIN